MLTDEQQQRARKLLTALANVTTTDMTLHIHDGRMSGCPFCTMPNYVTHTEDCPVTQARLLVNEILQSVIPA